VRLEREMKIWTIGTSTRSMREFLHVLRTYQIEHVVDIRRFPTSRYTHFKREQLKNCLEQHGIEYHHLARLGGYRKGGYRKHMTSVEFEQGLRCLEAYAASKRVAIMCAELLFFKCHRRFIADALHERGHIVIHILDDTRSYEHQGVRATTADRTLDEFLEADESSKSD
jgi:uncharacterized protein (DUF488 family)